MLLQPRESLATKPFSFFTITQFLGAFNDNIFKQMILLLAVGTVAGGSDKQGLVQIVFTIPFLLFSGYAGQLSEIYPKTTVLRLSKIAELFIMLSGGLAFYFQNMTLLLVVLFFMGTQSAFFGPAKYGVIPEMVKNGAPLVSANGIIQMTTIVAIILGLAVAGFLKTTFEAKLYVASFACVLISCLGITSVWMITKSKANKPDMVFELNPFKRLFYSFKYIFSDRALLLALVAYTYFYYSGALVINTVNNYGKTLLHLNDAQTSLLLVTLSVGVMVGSVLASPIQSLISGKWCIFSGAIGVCITEGLLYFHQMPLMTIKILLFLAGVSSALYFVPVAAFIQDRPELGKKGEILGAVNFSNFAGILLSAFVWIFGVNVLSLTANVMWLLLSGGLLLLLVIMFPQLKKLQV